MGSGILSAGVKRPVFQADNSPLTTVEVKEERSYFSTPPIRLPGVHREMSGFA
jgi:hypothetical protein